MLPLDNRKFAPPERYAVNNLQIDASHWKDAVSISSFEYVCNRFFNFWQAFVRSSGSSCSGEPLAVSAIPAEKL